MTSRASALFSDYLQILFTLGIKGKQISNPLTRFLYQTVKQRTIMGRDRQTTDKKYTGRKKHRPPIHPNYKKESLQLFFKIKWRHLRYNKNSIEFLYHQITEISNLRKNLTFFQFFSLFFFYLEYHRMYWKELNIETMTNFKK